MIVGLLETVLGLLGFNTNNCPSGWFVLPGPDNRPC